MNQKKAKGKAWENGYIISSGMALSSWGFAEIYKKEDIELYRENAKPIKCFSKAISEKKNVLLAYEWTEQNKI